jgi:hypothetical protein
LKVTPTDTGTIPQDPNNPTHTKPNPTQRKIPNEDHAHDDNASLSGQQTMSSSTIDSASYTPSLHLHLHSASTHVTVCWALTPSRATSQHRCTVEHSGMVHPKTSSKEPLGNGASENQQSRIYSARNQTVRQEKQRAHQVPVNREAEKQQGKGPPAMVQCASFSLAPGAARRAEASEPNVF